METPDWPALWALDERLQPEGLYWIPPNTHAGTEGEYADALAPCDDIAPPPARIAALCREAATRWILSLRDAIVDGRHYHWFSITGRRPGQIAIQGEYEAGMGTGWQVIAQGSTDLVLFEFCKAAMATTRLSPIRT